MLLKAELKISILISTLGVRFFVECC